MVHGIVIFFLVFATLFAFVHAVAMALSLYWWYWWFDIFMHLWGGVLIGLGVHAFSANRWFLYRPTFKTVLLTLLLITASWEIFERAAGLYDVTAYAVDTTLDLFLGFSGGLLAHFLLQTYRMK